MPIKITRNSIIHKHPIYLSITRNHWNFTFGNFYGKSTRNSTKNRPPSDPLFFFFFSPHDRSTGDPRRFGSLGFGSRSSPKIVLLKIDLCSAGRRRKSPLEPLKIAGKTRLQAIGFNGSRVASHGFSGLSGFLGSQVAGSSSWVPPELLNPRILVLAADHGGSDLPGLTGSFLGFLSLSGHGSLPRVQSVSTGDDCHRISLPFAKLHHPISPSLISLSLSLCSVSLSLSRIHRIPLSRSHSLISSL
jgi:hypothetical protein